jgi:DNA polymerase III psi subunit
MTEAQRQAYLEAMGIGVWTSKPAAPDPNRWVVGPGSGSTLLLCRTARESGTRLAADIGRSLGGDPVWAWPDSEQKQEHPSLEETIERYLFTQVLLFGGALASQAFKGSVPVVLGSAKVQVTADLDELASDGVARRKLWQCLSGSIPEHA